jgi:hypothetical protein
MAKPSVPSLNFAVTGEMSSGVTVLNNHFQYYQNGIYCNPFNDMASYYNKFAYNSRSGFAISTHDNISADNMICLETRDHSMTSHRWGFTDLGEENGFMVSEHTPFSNDRGTVIRTWMRPLRNGWHLRVHRVTLSQEYRIYEGGFSVGLWDDYRGSRAEGSGFSLWNRELISHIGTAASVSVKFAERHTLLLRMEHTLEQKSSPPTYVQNGQHPQQVRDQRRLERTEDVYEVDTVIPIRVHTEKGGMETKI